MKSKFFLTLFIMGLMAFSASARFVITISGGGANAKFNYIKLSDKECTCSGSGSLTCPIDFGVVSSPKQLRVGLKEITEVVFEQAASGEKSGEFTYGEDLPVKWTALDDNLMQIEIFDDGKTTQKEYEQREK